ncbi:MAG TPA: hypothetical protein VM368_08285 [Flavisolibacter sp.]|nr:hypothetical protein [Flavisolibacter sp.]
MKQRPKLRIFYLINSSFLFFALYLFIIEKEKNFQTYTSTAKQVDTEKENKNLETLSHIKIRQEIHSNN